MQVASRITPFVAPHQVNVPTILRLTLKVSPATSVLISSRPGVCVRMRSACYWPAYTYTTWLPRTKQIFCVCISLTRLVNPKYFFWRWTVWDSVRCYSFQDTSYPPGSLVETNAGSQLLYQVHFCVGHSSLILLKWIFAIYMSIHSWILTMGRLLVALRCFSFFSLICFLYCPLTFRFQDSQTCACSDTTSFLQHFLVSESLLGARNLVFFYLSSFSLFVFLTSSFYALISHGLYSVFSVIVLSFSTSRSTGRTDKTKHFFMWALTATREDGKRCGVEIVKLEKRTDWIASPFCFASIVGILLIEAAIPAIQMLRLKPVWLS